MLKNYEKLPNGVIKQKKIIDSIQKYDTEYVTSRYNSYGEKGLQMSYLRLGVLLGVIPDKINSILDVGYGNGDFLSICTDTISNCFGHDITNYGLPEKVTFVEDITSNFYDVICFFDSLEHFESISFVKDLRCNYVYISLPWCHYTTDNWFENWKHRRVDEHLWHFNDESLTNFFNECNFEKIHQSSIEDIIRKSDSDLPNILTCIFKRKT